MNANFLKKANDHKRGLQHRIRRPQQKVTFCADATAFQGLRVTPQSDFGWPIVLGPHESVILDFGDHCVGYLNLALRTINHIADSPVKLRFSFGEFPLEIEKDPAEYQGGLGSGWLQNEERTYVFMPCTASLERRYAFRYLKIERTEDNAPFAVAISDLYCDCVSAVDSRTLAPVAIPDEQLRRIYDVAVKTLQDCEQDVFEDGPKRDRRLWMGDLKLQAITDFVTFRNIDLFKRCMYLFAAYPCANGRISCCLFPDSPPHNDPWQLTDYALFFGCSLYDYIQAFNDEAFLNDLYPLAFEQLKIVSALWNEKTNTIHAEFFIDWCPDLDRSVAGIGVFAYALTRMAALAKKLGRADDVDFCNRELSRATVALMSHYDTARGLFVTPQGQVSWHSQIWAVLSGLLPVEQAAALLARIKDDPTPFTIRTPYMMHCYIDALFTVGEKQAAMAQVKAFWGDIVDKGFDCFPEIFNPQNDFESPYGAPEINSACHAWSCTPAYWIHRYYEEKSE